MPSTRRLVPALAGTAALGCALAGVAPLPASAAPPTTPFISEIHYDNAGTDTGEFVEVHLPPGTSSAGLSIVLYNGNGGAVYDTDAVPVVTAPDDAPAVAVVDYPVNGLQNGSPDAIALVRGNEVLELLSYEGTLTAVGGPADGLTSTDIGVAEGGSDPEGLSLSRSYDATRDALVWSGPATATRGAVNGSGTGDPEPEPDATDCDITSVTPVGAVQGTGEASPLDGSTVTVRGTVVGDLPGLSGFFLQDAGDGSAATSDGVFVYTGDRPDVVDLGDTVAATGRVSEYFEQTQVSAGSVEVCADGTAADLPDAAPLDLPATDAERERLEGMLVQPVDPLTVSEVYDLTSYGELTVAAGGVLVQPTELARPGTPEAAAVAEQNALRSLVLDDGVSARTSATSRPYLSPDSPVRVGDVLELQEPLVLGEGFGAYRLQPADGTAEGVFAPQDTRPAAPDEVGGDVQVAAFNVLNYFLQPRGDVPTRGARSAAEFEEQAAKIVSAINALGADVVALNEIEDTDSTGLTPGNADTALVDLVARLNEDLGDEVWAFVPLPEELYAVDRDVIRNAIVYRTDVVETVGAPVGLVDETVWSNAREPQAQAFVAEGDVFTVIANHFKSKSPGQPTGDNVDSGDGQGAWNGDRTRQAASLAAFAATLAEVDPDVLVMGDLNAYTQEDPVEVLRDAGFIDLGERFDAGRYSYVFDALSGSLDHALGTPDVAAKVTDVTHWNINAVESFAFQYSGDPALYAPDPFRSSDHDPLVLGLELVTAPVADAGGPYVLRKDGRGPRSTVLDAGGSSDANGDALSYAWDLDGDGQFDDATGARVVVDTKGRPPGDHVVAVRVTDAGGLSHVDTAVLSVRAGRGAEG